MQENLPFNPAKISFGCFIYLFLQHFAVISVFLHTVGVFVFFSWLQQESRKCKCAFIIHWFAPSSFHTSSFEGNIPDAVRLDMGIIVHLWHFWQLSDICLQIMSFCLGCCVAQNTFLQSYKVPAFNIYIHYNTHKLFWYVEILFPFSFLYILSSGSLLHSKPKSSFEKL